MQKRITHSFTQVLLQLLSLIFFSLAILLLLYPEEVSLITLVGVSEEMSIVVLQFLGSSYFILACLLNIIKRAETDDLVLAMIALNLFGFIHLFLIFKCNTYISLPYIYFAFQILVQILLCYCLVFELKKQI